MTANNIARLVELVQLISSIIDEKYRRSAIWRPFKRTKHTSPRAMPRAGSQAAEPSFSPLNSTQYGGQQQHGHAATQSAFPALPWNGISFHPYVSVTIATLHPDFRQPLLGSHLTKTTTTAITNGKYVDFATLLPISSLLDDSLNSQLRLGTKS